MNTEVIIYDYRKHTPKAKKMRRFFRILTIAGIIGLVSILSPMLLAETRYRLGTSSITAVPVEIQSSSAIITPVQSEGFGKLISQKYMKAISPVDASFTLIIPKIGVNSKVIPNVDVSDENAYNTALRKGIAHAAGSSIPGHQGNVYLFAHSTDFVWNVFNFNAIFYLLKDVNEGDVIYVVYNGDVFPYKVREKRIVDPTETNYLRPDYSGEQLTLQTCYPPGTTWKRLLVFADPISEWEGMQQLVSYAPK